MPPSKNTAGNALPALEKCPTGIQGLDEITYGGLPKGRPILLSGAAGCGKTLLAMEFIYRGAVEFNEPGVFITFEEKEKDLYENFSSLGFDLPELERQEKLFIDFIRVERSEIEETGEYDLEGLFVRLESAIDSIGAKRIVLDTIEALFAGLSNESILRAELRRLFQWLKDKGVTAIITGEKGEHLLTKHGLEEYVADCVIYLDHRVNEQLSTRRLKIIKYRGSRHGTNEYPFLIGEHGISIFPITSLELNSPVSDKKISSGMPDLDQMLGGEGLYQGTTTLISGSAGSGKTSLTAQFLDTVCRSGNRAMFFAFEESEQQIIRNMKSIGIELKQWVDKGLLKFLSHRGGFGGLEMHLVMMHKAINEFKPSAIVVDPINALIESGTLDETKAMLIRLFDFLRDRQIMVLVTDLEVIGQKMDTTEIGISSLCDTWIKLGMEQCGYQKKRRINILKARGLNHSHTVRELVLSENGISIKDIGDEKGCGQ